MRFLNKVCVITASASGIGYAIAELLGREGGKLVISSRNQRHVDAAVAKLTSQNIQAAGVVCHVSKDRAKLINFAIATYGSIDVLVNNAATSLYMGETLHTPERAYDKMFDTNVRSPFFLTQQALPHLKQSKGTVLFVSSVLGYIPDSTIGIYSITKTALLGVIRTLGLELMRYGVQVNGLAPGIIKTRFSTEIQESDLARQNAHGRLGTPEECASTAAFLCSADSSYLTGETIMINGGLNARL